MVSQNGSEPGHLLQTGAGEERPVIPPRSRYEMLAEAFFRRLCQAGALAVLLIAAGLAVVLVWKAGEAIQTLGIGFFTSTTWDPEPTHRVFGAGAFIYGTVVTSVIGMLIAVPLGVGAAVFLAEIAGPAVQRIGKTLVELLASVPSVVYGFWGVLVLAPAYQSLVTALGGPNQGGLGILPAGLILSIMIVPYVTAVSFEVVRAVPLAQREGAYAMGATRWQAIWGVILPYARTGISGGCFLALGRALGETMAVTMLIGNKTTISLSPFAQGNTIAIIIANNFTEADYDLYLSALVELALALVLVTGAFNVLARVLLWRMNQPGRLAPEPDGTGWSDFRTGVTTALFRLGGCFLAAYLLRQLTADMAGWEEEWPADFWLENVILLAFILLVLWHAVEFLRQKLPWRSRWFRLVLARIVDVVLLGSFVGPPLVLLVRAYPALVNAEFFPSLSDAAVWRIWAIGWLLGIVRLVVHLCRDDRGADRVATAILSLCLAISVGFLLFILGFLVYRGIGSLDLDFFTKLPVPPGETGGGMANAIVGSCLLVLLAALFAVPVGLLTAVYLAEYPDDYLGPAVRFVGELVSGVPSIVIGIFGYYVLVKPLGTFSAWAGAFALGVMMVPIVMRAAEEGLRMVPDSVRQASFALGAGPAQTILKVVVPGALRALLTAVFLGIARIVGETAPLLLTAFNNRLWPRSLSEPTPSLPYYIYSYAISPYDEWHRLGWAAALVLLVIVLVLNLGARLLMGTRATALADG
jgi:phosphate transport system permease protein